MVLASPMYYGSVSGQLKTAFDRLFAVAAGHTVNTFHSGRTPMSACLHCGGCWSTGKPCVLDDGFAAFWPQLEQSQMLVFCSPLYWYNFS